jgi:DNA-binding LytR/AlgR family response regulator
LVSHGDVFSAKFEPIFSVFMSVFENVAHIKVLIVDDDVLICETLADILTDLGFNRIKMVHSKGQLNQLLDVWRPDFILLDIRMERHDDGLVIGAMLNEIKIPYIYVTAHTDSETAKRVIQTHPHGFISKPIRTGELTVSIGLVLNNILSSNKSKLKVKHNNEVNYINPSDLLYIKSDGNYLEVFTFEKKYLIRNTLDQLLLELDSPSFERIHRSIVINKDHILSVSTAMVTLTGNIELPISRTFSKRIKS